MQWLLVGTQACPMALEYIGLLLMAVVVSGWTARGDMDIFPLPVPSLYYSLFALPYQLLPPFFFCSPDDTSYPSAASACIRYCDHHVVPV